MAAKPPILILIKEVQLYQLKPQKTPPVMKMMKVGTKEEKKKEEKKKEEK